MLDKAEEKVATDGVERTEPRPTRRQQKQPPVAEKEAAAAEKEFDDYSLGRRTDRNHLMAKVVVRLRLRVEEDDLTEESWAACVVQWPQMLREKAFVVEDNLNIVICQFDFRGLLSHYLSDLLNHYRLSLVSVARLNCTSTLRRLQRGAA